jgi:hypothetical protein
MPSPSPQPTEFVTITKEQLAQLEKQYPGLSETMMQFQQKASDAQAIQPPESATTLVCPADISQKDVQEYAKLGLSYETRADGVLLAVWEDPNTQKKHKFVHNPQAFVNANPPANVTWQKDGMVEQQVNIEGMKSVWHFNRNGANTYAQQLASKQVKLADNTLIQSIASKFGGQMHKAFGIPLTSWSHPDGNLDRVGVGLDADLWLDGRCLDVDRDGA